LTKRLRTFFLVISLCHVSSANSQEQPSPPQSVPTVRVDVSRVEVGVTVTDSHGHLIGGLQRRDFHVFDNGVEQPITDFLSIDEPAHVVLLVESGPAVRLLGAGHIRAADTLLSSFAPDDRVAIVKYSNAPSLLLEFTPDKDIARNALAQVNFKLGFGDLNLTSSLSAILDWLAPLPQKKTIVLLSTGVDTSPPEYWPAIQQKLQACDVRILSVSLSGDFRKPQKRKKLSPQEREDRAFVKEGFVYADRQLRAVSEATGGRAYFPRNTEEFGRIYAEIAQLVRHEYSLAFVPPSQDGQLHSITVKVKHSRYRVDHRQTYLAPPPEKH
jgi:Ca-activated chloride channel family protein